MTALDWSPRLTSLASRRDPHEVGDMAPSADLPEFFCWTRFGTEAGETIEDILARKEAERVANGGVFLWGIGNSISGAIRELVRLEPEPAVIFSPIKSRPRAVDVSPVQVVEYRGAESLEGERFALPLTFQVRGGLATDRPRPRYALVCYASDPLALAESGCLSPTNLANLLSGAALGASQVTAVVRRRSLSAETCAYPIAIRARLVAPYFIRLHDPQPLEKHGPADEPRPVAAATLLAQLSLWDRSGRALQQI